MHGQLPWAGVIPLLGPQFNLLGFVSTLKTSKSVLQECWDSIPDQQLQQLLQDAVHNKPKTVTSLTPLDHVQQTQFLHAAVASCPSSSSISWLLQQCCKRWGIVSVATRLDLQAALIEAKQDTILSVLFISAGARISLDLLLNHAHPQAPAQWFQAYQVLGLSLDLPPLARTLCSYSSNSFNGMQIPNMQSAAGLQPQYLQQLSLQELLQYAKLTLSIVSEEETCYALVGRLLSNFTTISPEQLLEIMVQAARAGKYMYCLASLLQTPLAQAVPGEGYAELLQAMSLTRAHATTPGDKRALRDVMTVVIRRVTWSGGLVHALACKFHGTCTGTALPAFAGDICMRCLLFVVVAYGDALVPSELRVQFYTAALHSGHHHPSAPGLVLGLLRGGVGLTSSKAVVSAMSAQLELKVPPFHIRALLDFSATAITPETLLQLLQLAIASDPTGAALSAIVTAIPSAWGLLSLGQLSSEQLRGLEVSGHRIGGSEAKILAHIFREVPLARRVPVVVAQQLISRCLKAEFSDSIDTGNLSLFLSALPVATVREALQGLWPVVLGVDRKVQQQLLVHLVPIECSLVRSSCCVEPSKHKLEERGELHNTQQQQQQEQQRSEHQQEKEQRQEDQQERQQEGQGVSRQQGQQSDQQQQQHLVTQQCNVCTVLQETGNLRLPFHACYKAAGRASGGAAAAPGPAMSLRS